MATTVNYDYLPSEEGPRAAWLNNFAARLVDYAATLGVDSADVNYTSAAAESYNYVVFTLSDALHNLSKAFTSFKEHLAGDRTPDPLSYPILTLPQPPMVPVGVDLKSGLFVWINELVLKIRKSPNYTDTIGLDLGIMPLPKPVVVMKGRIVKLEAFPGSEVEISFVRKGAKLVIIESRREYTEWQVLDKVAASNYRDRRPPLTPGQAEVRHYRIRLSDGKNPIGDYSEEMSIATRV